MDNKCVFLDRDGVLNEGSPSYIYRPEQMRIIAGAPEALQSLRHAGFLLVVITNQSGISQRRYTERDVDACHRYLQRRCKGAIDAFYFSPYHPRITASLSRKPGALLFERAIARFAIAPQRSWMVGDRDHDLTPARALGMQTIYVGDEDDPSAWRDYAAPSIVEAASLILSRTS